MLRTDAAIAAGDAMECSPSDILPLLERDSKQNVAGSDGPTPLEAVEPLPRSSEAVGQTADVIDDDRMRHIDEAPEGATVGPVPGRRDREVAAAWRR